MSVRKLITDVLDCDTCDEVYADVVPESLKNLEAFAQRDGWKIEYREGPTIHTCPECRAKQQMSESA